MLADDVLQVESRADRICDGRKPSRRPLGRIPTSMPHTSRPALAVLTAGCLLFLLVDGLAAQTAARKTKKSAPIQPVQARDDDQELEAPPPRARAGTNSAAPAKRRPIPQSAPETDPAEAPARATRQPRPEMQPDRVEKLSPELEALLKEWETHSSKFKKLEGSFKRFKYDHTFSVEFWATGKFAYEAPDKGYYQYEGSEIPGKAVSRKTYEEYDDETKKVVKKPYALKSDLTEHWVCDGKQILKINDREKQFEKVPIPPENQGANIIDGPLPFLFGMKVDRAKRRYTFSMLEPKPGFKDTVWLLVKPKLPMDASNWSEARVGINRNTYLPVAVMLTDPSGNSETVHLFADVEANGKAGFFTGLLGGGNPFQPDLRKYKLVQNEKPGLVDGAEPEAPGVSTRPPAAAGTKGRTTTNERNDRDLPRSADTSAGGTRPGTKASRK
jgi:TIGR03009 family protein